MKNWNTYQENTKNTRITKAEKMDAERYTRVSGQKLKYKGRGFLGFDPNDKTMVFIENYDSSLGDIWVKYKGEKMIIKNYEVENTL